MSEKADWEAYLDRYAKGYNSLPELPSIIKPIAPLLFQYQMTDKPELSYWFLIEEEKISWGMGQNPDTSIPKIIHKTDIETMKKVNSGETDPIQATMAGSYVVEGDVTKLMACAALLPLGAKAHAKAQEMK